MQVMWQCVVSMQTGEMQTGEMDTGFKQAAWSLSDIEFIISSPYCRQNISGATARWT
jgi:hypothetical protein